MNDDLNTNRRTTTTDAMDKLHPSVPVSQKRISLNIDDLPPLEPYPPLREEPPRPLSGGRRGVGFGTGPPASSQGSWLAAKQQRRQQGGPAAGWGSPTRLLPDDLNISWEYTQPSSGAEGGNGGKVTLQVESSQAAVSGASGNASFQLCATGKRPQGIGTENVRQEIVTAERGDGSVVLRVTLLAAGFVVGPNGASIHQIEAITGASIYSFNRQKDSEVDRPTRQFHVEGGSDVVQHAVDVICHAIQLYKDLAEGNHANVTVKRLHKLDGVIFRYEPPPRSKVPFAAQVEYEAAELAVLQSTRDPRSHHGIRDVRDQLARRDEGVMRSNLPTGRQQRQVSRRGRRGSGRPEIQLGQPEIQDHDMVKRQLFDDFEGMLSLAEDAQKPEARSAHSSGGIRVRAHQVIRTSVESIPAHGSPKVKAAEGPAVFGQLQASSVTRRQDTFKAKVSFKNGGPKDGSPGRGRPSPVLAGRASRAQEQDGSERAWSGRWNNGGLYGIDSLM